MYLEIRDQDHLMTLEGNCDKKPSKREIIRAFEKRNKNKYWLSRLIIWYDTLQKLYRFNGHLTKRGGKK